MHMLQSRNERDRHLPHSSSSCWAQYTIGKTMMPLGTTTAECSRAESASELRLGLHSANVQTCLSTFWIAHNANCSSYRPEGRRTAQLQRLTGPPESQGRGRVQPQALLQWSSLSPPAREQTLQAVPATETGVALPQHHARSADSGHAVRP